MSPKPRQSKIEKVRAALGVAERRAASTKKRLEKAQAEVASLEAEYKLHQAQYEHIKSDPILSIASPAQQEEDEDGLTAPGDEEDTPPGVEFETTVVSHGLGVPTPSPTSLPTFTAG